MLPNFIIIGAARCATTWISQNLSHHPEIFIPSKKELHFFDKHYEKGIAYYESYFVNRHEKAIGEATPAYLFFPNISSLIQKHIPDVKLITSLRNPVDRAFSHYLFLKACAENNSINKLISFEEKLKKTSRLIEEGFYYDMLLHYHNKFPKENILVLIYENMKQNPNAFLKQIYSFLDVDSTFLPPLINYKVNASSARLGKTKSLFFLYLVLKKLKLYKTANFFEKINKKEKFEMSQETRSQLNSVFLNQIEKLESMLSLDLAAWKQ